MSDTTPDLIRAAYVVRLDRLDAFHVKLMAAEAGVPALTIMQRLAELALRDDRIKAQAVAGRP